MTEEVRHLGGGRASGSGQPRHAERAAALPKKRPEQTREAAASDRAHRGSGSGDSCRASHRASEPASGSGGPSRDEVRVVDTSSGMPDLEEPFTVDQAVDMWRYLLFDRNSFVPGRGKIRETWLPQETLTNVPLHCEAMSEYNMQMLTICLLTMIRYLMAELSQTMSMAQAIRNTRLGLTDPVDLDDEEDDEGDGSVHMQTFFQTDGRDSMPRRWARALLRLHKELEGQPKSMRVRSVAALRGAMPTLMMELEAVSYQAQLQALVVAVQDDSQEAQGQQEAPEQWMQGWVQEISAFIPGYRRGQDAQLVDSVPEEMIDELVRDEEEAKAERLAMQLQAEEEEDARQKAEAAQEALCLQEVQHLEEEAAQYKQWERSEEDRAFKRARLNTTSDHHRCVLKVEVATGSGDHPRVVRTLGLDLPVDGTQVSLRLRAEVERAPSEVSTLQLHPPTMDPLAAATLAEASGAVEPDAVMETLEQPVQSEGMETGHESQAAQCNTAPGLLQLMEFDEYEVLYDRWSRGELNQSEVLLHYGADVLELML